MIVDGARCDDHNARTHRKYTKACDIHRAALSMFIRCRWIVVGDTNHWIGYVGLTVCIWPSLSQQANVGMPIGSQCNSISPSCARIRQSSFDRVILVGGRVECRQDSAPLRYGKWVGLTRKKKKKIIALLVPETRGMSALNTYNPISGLHESSHRTDGNKQNLVSPGSRLSRS